MSCALQVYRRSEGRSTAIAAKGALAVIPNNPSRALKYPLDKHLYAQRHLVECCFSKLKQFRRVATRFEKTARNYRAVVTLAAIHLMDAISVHTTFRASSQTTYAELSPTCVELQFCRK